MCATIGTLCKGNVPREMQQWTDNPLHLFDRAWLLLVELRFSLRPGVL